MSTPQRSLPLLAAAFFLLTTPALLRATTYKMVGDANLVAQAAAVAEVRITSLDSAPTEGWPATDYLVAVERVLHGDVPGSSLIVRVPGGRRVDGMAFRIFGAPAFMPGERALLFLAPNADGSFRILHLMLGAFHEIQADGRWLAVRDLSAAHEVHKPGVPAAEDGARDREKFSRWITDRAHGVIRQPDYFVAWDGAGSIENKFTFEQPRMRWFEFDLGQSVAFKAHEEGQPGVDGGGFAQFQAGLKAWDADAATNINYVYAGLTALTGGLNDFDGTNAILFNRPLPQIDPFNCDTGGVLAIGGPWYDSDVTGTYNGQTYVRIQGGDIVTNTNLECFFTASPDPLKAAEELFGHELGHTLGLAHSCGDGDSGLCIRGSVKDDALMRASVHNDGRGARLNADDKAGIAVLYTPSSVPTGPMAPGSLSVTLAGLTANLAWQDRSSDEDGFRVYRGVNGGALTLLATLPAGSTSYGDAGLAANTRYDYQVAAFNKTGEGRSAKVGVKTPAIQPVTATITPSSGGQTGEPVAFQAQFTGPARSARWDFASDAAGFSEAPCAAGLFCVQHIFTHPGTYQVKVTVTGDQGQTAQSVQPFTITGSDVQLPESKSFLQSVLFAPRGNTGTFKSDVWLHDASAFPVLVRFTFLPRGAGSASPAQRDVTLSAGNSLFLPNVLSTLFGQTNQQGSLALEYMAPTSQSGATPRVFAFSRSYVDQPGTSNGSFGQLVGEEPEATWTADAKVVPGILEGNGFISSITAVNLDGSGGNVTVELLDAQGGSVGAPVVFSLGARTLRFQTTAKLFPDVVHHSGPFVARLTSSGVRFTASATLLEAVSQDQIFIPAAPPPAAGSGVSSGEVFFPRIVRGPGQFNTTLASNLVAFNASPDQSRQITFELWQRGQDNTTPLTAQRTIAPGASLLVGDVVHDLFGLDAGTGALHVTWKGPQGPGLRIVSLTLASTQGKQFGTLVDSEGATAAGTAAVDFGAEQTAVSRSSYGAVNLSTSPTTLHLTLKTSTGTVLGQADIGLQPQQHFERGLAGIFTGLADGSDWFMETAVVSGGPVLTYLANINVSGDVFYVPGHAQ